MSSVKNFIIKGVFKKKDRTYDFSKLVRALRKEDAIEKIYTDLGSNHRVKRRDIEIKAIEEIEETVS
ncbi:MAG: 50S ribosomal protein L18Ae [Promethearchaeota archaeon]